MAELGGLLLDGFGGAAVGADAEGVGGVDLEEGGGFVEEAGDRDIVHGGRSVAGREPVTGTGQYASGEGGITADWYRAGRWVNLAGRKVI